MFFKYKFARCAFLNINYLRSDKLVDTAFTVISNKPIKQDIYCMRLRPDSYQTPVPGSFINISVPNRTDLLLRRPFAITDWDDKGQMVELCYKVAGGGTAALTVLKCGDRLTGVYPLGNGFDLRDSKRIAIIGGGIGVFPLLSVLRHAKGADRRFYTMLGYRDGQSAVFIDEFSSLSKASYVCTDDCSIGDAGFVTDLLNKHYDEIKPDMVIACGPAAMLAALQKLMRERYPKVPAYVSLEERMCCGFGACIVCTCKIDNGSGVKNKRVCYDGPVFALDEVVF